MKKNSSKKITLNRETLRLLQDRTLENAAGALPSGRPFCNDTYTGRDFGGCLC